MKRPYDLFLRILIQQDKGVGKPFLTVLARGLAEKIVEGLDSNDKAGTIMAGRKRTTIST